MEERASQTGGPAPGRGPGDRARANGEGGGVPGDGSPPPNVLDALRELRASGTAGLGAAREAAGALGTLVRADFSLARSAAGRAAVLAGLGIVFGASAWLMLMTALVVLLSIQLGLPWSVSLLVCTAASGLGAWLALRKATDYFEHTRMKATRRQLARLGIGELSAFMPGPGDPECAHDVAERTKPHGGSVPGDSTAAGVTPP